MTITYRIEHRWSLRAGGWIYGFTPGVSRELVIDQAVAEDLADRLGIEIITPVPRLKYTYSFEREGDEYVAYVTYYWKDGTTDRERLDHCRGNEEWARINARHYGIELE